MSECYYPVTMRKMKAGSMVEQVRRCGQCIQCRSTIQNEWAFRLYSEKRHNPIGAIWTTLTYAPEHLPIGYLGNPTLVEKHHTDLIKRIRKNTGLKLKFKLSAEMGDQFDRPHLHYVIYGINPDYKPQKLLFLTPEEKALLRTRGSSSEGYKQVEIMLMRAWDFKGHIDVNEVLPATCTYVMGYVMKKILSQKELAADQLPEFTRISNNIGMIAVPYYADKFIAAKLYPEDHPYLRITPEWQYNAFNAIDIYQGYSDSNGGSTEAHQLKKKSHPLSQYYRKAIIECMAEKLKVVDNTSDITKAIILDMRTRSKTVKASAIRNGLRDLHGDTEGERLSIKYFESEEQRRANNFRKINKGYRDRVAKSPF